MRGEVVDMGRSVLAWTVVALPGAALATAASAAPRDVDRRLEPSRVSPLPSQVRRVEPAVVGIRVEVEPDRPSAATLWQGEVDRDVHVTVERPGGRHAITVRPVVRHRFYRTSDR
jgi:hypothetical protein